MKKKYLIIAFLVSFSILIGGITIEKKFAKLDLNKGLILYYSLDDIKGNTIQDKSGNKNDGKVEGDVTTESLGKIEGSVFLNGQGSIKMPDNILKGTNEITVSAWICFNPTNVSDWQRIYDFGTDENNNLFLSKNRTINLKVNKNVEGINGSKLFEDNKWYFVTTTIGNGNIVYYENGVEVGRKKNLKNKISFLSNSTNNYIGKSKYQTDPGFNGYIDEFRIYNRALTSEEISELMYDKMPDKDVVDMESEKISLNEKEEVAGSIKLPTTSARDVKVSWKSSNEKIITKDGKVTLPSGKDDVKVNLIANIERGKYSISKKFTLTVQPKNAVNYKVEVQAGKPKFNISPTLYGLFFEDINHAADGGLYAQLINNDSFQYDNNLENWKIIKKGKGNNGNVQVLSMEPLNANNSNYVRVANGGSGEVGISNSGYRGINVEKNAKYDFSVWARSLEKSKLPIKIQLETAAGKVISEVKSIEGVNDKWAKYETQLTASLSDTNARLVVYTKGSGTVDMDMVSLFPQDTWKGVKYGLRKDLVQMLYDMKPKFLRFPGGCIVQGKTGDDMYEWKDTIGNIEERKLNKNFWGYYQSYGLGFYEYFKLCEDIGAEPLPVINAGMSWQNAAGNGVSQYMAEPGEELNKYIQDALDLIEYANGSPATTWGKKRAESGHPEPFNLKYLAIGNEQWGDDYFERFEAFKNAINAKYPNIKLVINSGTAPAGTVFDAAWDWTKANNFKGLVDEHYYMPNDWFLTNTHRYDNYDRNGAQVFVGEYAAQDENKENNLGSALAEAAYMTGLEKNSDIVKMAAYAPLFAKENDSQWTPDMIWFNGKEAYGTPNYYVQKLFSTNTGNKLLDSTVQKRNSKVPDLYMVSSLDEKTNEVIIKVVNTSTYSKKIQFDLEGVADNNINGIETVLWNSDVKSENSFSNKWRVVPVTKKIKGLSSVFKYDVNPESVTIIKLKISK